MNARIVSLTLDLDTSSLPTEDRVREMARRVVRFRDDLDRVFRRNLSDDLFVKMACVYMPSAISKIGLAKEYQELIMDIPLKKRTRKQVVSRLNKVLKFEPLEAAQADPRLVKIYAKLCARLKLLTSPGRSIFNSPTVSQGGI